MNNFYYNNITNKMELEHFFGSYLAGLWEGDGHISLVKKTNNTIQPVFSITFNSKDLPLATKLMNILGGTIQHSDENQNWVRLNIRKREQLVKIVALLNGKIRTPKIYEFNNLISFLNSALNLTIPIYSQDQSFLSTNAWLAGFIDADGGFKIRITEKKVNPLKNRIIQKGRLAVQFVLEQRLLHPKTNESFYPVFEQIAKFFTISNDLILPITYRTHNETKKYLCINVFSMPRLNLLANYLSFYPLLTSKQNDFADWSKILYLMTNRTNHIFTLEDKEYVREIKSRMNRKRKTINWDHIKVLDIIDL